MDKREFFDEDAWMGSTQTKCIGNLIHPAPEVVMGIFAGQWSRFRRNGGEPQHIGRCDKWEAGRMREAAEWYEFTFATHSNGSQTISGWRRKGA